MEAMRPPLFLRALCLTGPLLAGCVPGTIQENGPAPAASRSLPTGPSAHFVDVAQKAGIAYRWVIKGKRPLTILQTIGNGCAFLDYDGDGNLDVLLVGPRVALYRGDGKGNFADVSARAGLDRLAGDFLGCAVGDYDGDGDPDVYLTAYRGGALLRNDGGRFLDVSRAAGIAPQPWGSSAAFGDVNGDQRLDLYIGNYVVFGPHEIQLCDFNGIKGSCGPRFYKPERGVLYLNKGRGRFRDVTRAWHADRVSGKALGVAFADPDNSGRDSIAIANDEVPGDLLKAVGSRFVNVGPNSGTAFDSDGSVHGGMGVDWGDYNNDLRLDLVVAAFAHEPDCVYRNEGEGLFTELSAPLRLRDPTLPYIAFGAKWLDFDNDGWLDLMFANGHVQDNVADLDPRVSYKEPTQLFRNLEGRQFQDLGSEAGEDLRRRIVGRGLAVGDYDSDGLLDALVVDCEGGPLLLHNESANTGHWLTCRLLGARSPRDGTGAVVTLDAGGRKQVRRCGTDGSYMSASDSRVHFGAGPYSGPVTLTVRWPSGRTDSFRDVPVDRVVTLREGGAPVRLALAKRPNQLRH